MNLRSLFAVAAAALIAAPAAVTQTGEAQSANCLDGAASLWLGSFGFGAVCGDAAGWQPVTKQTKAVSSDQIRDIEVCGDKTVIASTVGLHIRQKGKWRTEKIKSGVGTLEAIDCDDKGTIWISHFDGASSFDGKRWTTFKADKLGTDRNIKVGKDVAVAKDGKVWVVTANSVAMYNGKDWRSWEVGRGFQEQQFFGHLSLDSKGAPWVTAIGGVWTFEDGAWNLVKGDDLFSIEALHVDAKDRIWVGTYSNGLFVYESGGWTNYNRDNSDIASNHVNAIASDSRGRVWIATEYGLNVLEKDEWQVYRMDTSGMVDNNLTVLEVEGAGPDLVKPGKSQTGGLSGIVSNAGKPVAGVEIQLCVEFIGSSFRSATPCEDQPFSKIAKTDKSGKYEFKDLPVGVYGVVFKQPSGKWARLVTEFGIGSERILVAAGKTTDKIDLDLSNVKTS
jgi:hypothetical protein